MAEPFNKIYSVGLDNVCPKESGGFKSSYSYREGDAHNFCSHINHICPHEFSKLKTRFEEGRKYEFIRDYRDGKQNIIKMRNIEDNKIVDLTDRGTWTKYMFVNERLFFVTMSPNKVRISSPFDQKVCCDINGYANTITNVEFFGLEGGLVISYTIKGSTSGYFGGSSSEKQRLKFLSNELKEIKELMEFKIHCHCNKNLVILKRNGIDNYHFIDSKTMDLIGIMNDFLCWDNGNLLTYKDNILTEWRIEGYNEMRDSSQSNIKMVKIKSES